MRATLEESRFVSTYHFLRFEKERHNPFILLDPCRKLLRLYPVAATKNKQDVIRAVDCDVIESFKVLAQRRMKKLVERRFVLATKEVLLIEFWRIGKGNVDTRRFRFVFAVDGGHKMERRKVEQR